MATHGNHRPLLDDSETSDTDNFIDNDYTESSQNKSRDTSEEDTIKFSQNAPADKWNFTYMVFYLLGMTTLIPWNFFVTAEDYWMYKFRNLTDNSSIIITPIQRSLTSDLSVAAAVPSTLFLILNAFLSHLIPLKTRMVGSITIILALFIVTTAFVEVNTDEWQDGFFVLTISTVVILNIFAAILSGGLFGIAGLFPSEYITAVVSGQALGGMFAAFAEIISLTFGASAKTTAFVYFTIGNVVLIISLILYLIMSRTVYFRYFVVQRCKEISSSQSLEALDGTPSHPNYDDVFRKIYLYACSEWFVFVITLCIYPSVTVLVQSQYHGNGHLWNDIYFTPVANYLIFNSGDYLGRILAGIFERPRNKPHTVLLMSVIRAGFIPALMMGNSTLHNYLPIMIHSDVVFIILMIAFAVSNGYIANLALIMAPRAVMQHEKEMASSMMAACLGVGLAVGSLSSMILVKLF